MKAVSKVFQPLCDLLERHSISELKSLVDKWRGLKEAGKSLATGGLFGVKEMRWVVTEDYQFRGDWATAIDEGHIAFVSAILKAAERLGKFAGVSKGTLSILRREIEILENALKG